MKFLQHQRNSILKITILHFVLLLCINAHSQDQKLESRNFEGKVWKEFVSIIENNYKLKVYYSPETIPQDFRIKFTSIQTTLEQLFQLNLEPLGLFSSFDKTGNVFITREIPITTSLPDNFYDNLKEKVKDTLIRVTAQEARNYLKTTTEYVVEKITVGKKRYVNKDAKVKVRGYITDALTNEPIVGATIYIPELEIGVASDFTGLYEITLIIGKYIFEVKSVSTIDKKLDVTILSGGILDISLDEKVIQLRDVVIHGQEFNKVKGTQMGVERFTAQSVKKLPLIFGEKDIVKIALMLPGIQSVGEASSGINVRGSPTDQNLFYINNLPIYNTSHASGFLSAFNSDVIDQFSLYKSNIPIEYGGRLSSIFDIDAKKGNPENITASGGISTISARLLVEGPIVNKNTGTFMIGARSTYSDWILKIPDDYNLNNSSMKFADFVSNFNFQMGKKDQLNLFSYYSYDKTNLFAAKTKYDYKNIGSSINWKHFFNANSNFDLSIAHSIYDYSEENIEQEGSNYIETNKVNHTELKAVFNLKPNQEHTLSFGIGSILYNLEIGERIPLSSESTFNALNLGRDKGIESGIFFGDEWAINSKFSLNAGIRFNHFVSLGPQEIKTYAEGVSRTQANVSGTLSFDKNKIVKSYSGIDLRVAGKYTINDDLSFKVAYNRLHQYVFMLSNTVAVSPNFKWKLVDYHTKPIVGDQFSLGLFANLFMNRYEFSAEAYYKKVDNLVELKDGADIFRSKNIEQTTLQGNLDAYGIEFMLKKMRGRLTGWINYTYSTSSVLVNSVLAENRINHGISYPSNYNKPHAVNIVANYDIIRRFSVSGNLVYSTGRPITYPTSYYMYNGIKTLNYSKRNEYRIPDYLRFDLSFTLEGNLKKKKFAHGTWTVSIYNVLGRNNAYSVYFKQVGDNIKGYKLSIFSAPIFSITYNFKLGNYES